MAPSDDTQRATAPPPQKRSPKNIGDILNNIFGNGG
jgi:hypothetical protein